MKRTEKGFAHWLLFLLILLVLVAIGFVGWRVYSKKQAESSTKTQDAATSQQKAEEQEQTEEYVNKTAWFSLQKPKSWSVIEEKQPDDWGDGKQHYSGVITFKTASGTELVVTYNGGGIGGGCEPEADDKPFQAGNICPSQEYTKVTKLDIDNNTSRLSEPSYLVRSHIMQDNQGGTLESFQICLESHSDNYAPVANKPYTGFVYSCGVIATKEYAVRVYAQSTDKNFYDSKDAQAIEKALQSFKLLPFVN